MKEIKVFRSKINGPRKAEEVFRWDYSPIFGWNNGKETPIQSNSIPFCYKHS